MIRERREKVCMSKVVVKEEKGVVVILQVEFIWMTSSCYGPLLSVFLLCSWSCLFFLYFVLFVFFPPFVSLQ